MKYVSLFLFVKLLKSIIVIQYVTDKVCDEPWTQNPRRLIEIERNSI